MHINDNIYMNIDGFSVKLFDDSLRVHKEKLLHEEKSLLVDNLMAENDLEKQESILHNATDRILLAHRNLKLMLFMTSGPFFIILFFIKYSIKFGVLYFLYKKN